MACLYILVLFSILAAIAFLPLLVSIDQAEAIPLDLDSRYHGGSTGLVERCSINDKFLYAGVFSSSRFLCSTPIAAFCDGLSMGGSSINARIRMSMEQGQMLVVRLKSDCGAEGSQGPVSWRRHGCSRRGGSADGAIQDENFA